MRYSRLNENEINATRVAGRILMATEIVCLLLFAGCQVGPTTSSGPSDPIGSSGIQVGISPGTGSVQVQMVFQFAATVLNDSANKGVTWSVDNSAGCDCGTIDSTGKYFAPKTQHYAPGLVIRATSVSDPTKSNTAVIFVTPAPTGLNVSPSFISVPVNQSQWFNAAGTPFGTVPVVTWSVSGSGCTATNCGTIDATGKYTAPASIPNPSAVQVTAISVADSSVLASATVFIGSAADNPNNSKLNGQYAFLVRGYDGDGNGAMAGSFAADGAGNITGGVADYNFSSAISILTGLTFTGTYSVNSDNRASITISGGNARNPSFVNQTFSLSLGSIQHSVATRGRLIETDGVWATGTGMIAKQDSGAFSTTAIAGDYAFGFGGTAASGYPLTTAGRFTASGGALSAGHTDVYGLGLSESGAGTVTGLSDAPFAGSYQVSSNGRGTAVLSFSDTMDPGFSQFAFYVISASELWFIEMDSCGAGMCTFKGGISGPALSQTGGPYSQKSLKGTSILNLTWDGDGTGTAGGVAVGEAICDGNGNVSVTEDRNMQGAIATAAPTGGTYSVDGNGLGRGLLSLPGDSQARPFYMVSLGTAFMMDASGYDAGMLELQTGAPFSNSSLSGGFVVGTIPWDFNWLFNPSVGILSADGLGRLMETTDAIGASDVNESGRDSVETNGRATIFATSANGISSNWVFYLVSPSKAVGVDGTPGTQNSAIRVIEK